MVQYRHAEKQTNKLDEVRKERALLLEKMKVYDYTNCMRNHFKHKLNLYQTQFEKYQVAECDIQQCITKDYLLKIRTKNNTEIINVTQIYIILTMVYTFWKFAFILLSTYISENH